MERVPNQDYNKDREIDKKPDPGISNRPKREEDENQERLPPRGEPKPGD